MNSTPRRSRITSSAPASKARVSRLSSSGLVCRSSSPVTASTDARPWLCSSTLKSVFTPAPSPLPADRNDPESYHRVGSRAPSAGSGLVPLGGDDPLAAALRVREVQRPRHNDLGVEQLDPFGHVVLDHAGRGRPARQEQVDMDPRTVKLRRPHL